MLASIVGQFSGRTQNLNLGLLSLCLAFHILEDDCNNIYLLTKFRIGNAFHLL